MSASTKLVLIVVTLLVGVSFLYYGVILPGDDRAEIPIVVPDGGASDGAEAASSSAAGSGRPGLAAGSLGGNRSATGRPALGGSRSERPALGGPASARPAQPQGSSNNRDVAERPALGTSRDTGRPSLGARIPEASDASAGPGTPSTLFGGGDPVAPADRPARTSLGSDAGSRPNADPATSASGTTPRPALGGSTPRPTSGTGRPTPPRLEPLSRSAVARPATGEQPAAPTRRAADTLTGSWTVADGDTLSRISMVWFGEARHWKRIQDANPGVNPSALRVGQRLVLPPKRTALAGSGSDAGAAPSGRSDRRPASPAEQRSHVVAEGDTLSSIAARYLGTASAWPRLAEANRQTLGGDPDRLKLGMTLVIPARASD